MRILFLCTGNSCRSQMAEGFARVLAPAELEVYSAGTAPVGVNPRAIAAMAEIDVPIDVQRSKSLAEVPDRFDLVVTLCGDAAETCPAFAAGTRVEHWPLPDPAAATGSEDVIRERFAEVRDDIGRRVERLIASVTAGAWRGDSDADKRGGSEA